MHAPVEALEIPEIVERASAASRKRVVETDLDVRLGGEGGEGRFDRLRVLVVDEDAHAHPAPFRLPQRIEGEEAGLVAMPDVVLRVDRALGDAGEQHSRGESIGPLDQRINARLPGLGGREGQQGRAQARFHARRERLRGNAVVIRRQRRAPGEKDEQKGANMEASMGVATDTVYIVDDDISFARGLARLVGAAGWNAEVYTRAADFLAAHPSGAGCVLLDRSAAAAGRVGNGNRFAHERANDGHDVSRAQSRL